MSAATIQRHLAPAFVAIGLLASAAITPAYAQSKPQPRASSTSAKPSRSVSIAGYAMFGNISFTATESFDAILGSTSGPIFGFTSSS